MRSTWANRWIAIHPVVVGIWVTACADRTEVWIAQNEAAHQYARQGRFEPILGEIWAEDGYETASLSVLGQFSQVPAVDQELVAIYRMHPDSRAAFRAHGDLESAAASLGHHRSNCERRGCLEYMGRLDLDKIPRPRLFFGEACASLGLRWLETRDIWPDRSRCLTLDGYDVDPTTASHLLWQRHRGELATPITGATLPYPVEEHLRPMDYGDSGLPNRHRFPDDASLARQTDLWRADLASWVPAGSDGETRVPGPPPTPFTVPPEPTRRAWERVGVPPAPEFP